GSYGQLGQVTSAAHTSSPVQVGTLTSWSKIAAGGGTSLAIKADGTAWVWGYGNDGQLGQVTDKNSRSSPVQIGTLTNWSLVFGGRPGLVTVHSFSLAIKTDGTAWAWGRGAGLGQVTSAANTSS